MPINIKTHTHTTQTAEPMPLTAAQVDAILSSLNTGLTSAHIQGLNIRKTPKGFVLNVNLSQPATPA